MPRYFIEVSYLGTNYSGFQSQENANTVQAEMEKALKVLLREKIILTGSSRTDTGVHALQNYFHFDTARELISQGQLTYKLNAITPFDISVKKILRVNDEAHCRFDAVSRDYAYFIYQKKNPFLADRAFYFPFRLDMESMSEAAEKIKSHQDFTSFSKRNTQVKTFNCNIFKSEWKQQDECWVYEVSANRFLRGMVRAMVATMLQVGRGKLSIEEFESIITSRDCTRASFAVPGRGLFLSRVNFKTGLG